LGFFKKNQLPIWSSVLLKKEKRKKKWSFIEFDDDLDDSMKDSFRTKVDDGQKKQIEICPKKNIKNDFTL